MREKTKILFVDDEPNILDGLRRMLRSMRKEWDMTFAPGGQNALDTLAEKSFDVIVSDMHMPGIDGAQLLNIVKQQYPQMVRIALSGQTSKGTILKSVGPIHQYISKPCDAATLKNTIAHVCSLEGLLANEKLLGLITQLETLPSISFLYADLMAELQSENASIDRVAEIISRDVGMSAKIMQLVNSAFFGVRQNVTKVSQAVALLGLETITALALSIKIFSQFEPFDSDKFSLSSLWEHSMQVSRGAKLIAQAENAAKEIADCAMIAGMLHDVGKIVFATNIPNEYEQILSLAAQNNIVTYQAEKENIGATHAEVGAYLLGLWGFSNTIIEALTYHHSPLRRPIKEFSVLTAVHAADILTYEFDTETTSIPEFLRIDTDYLEELNLIDRLSIWRDICRKDQKETIKV